MENLGATINLSILDFKSAQYKKTNGDVMAINLSILDFKFACT